MEKYMCQELKKILCKELLKIRINVLVLSVL